MADEKKLLGLLKSARTALKLDKPKTALAHVRAAIELLEPVKPREPIPGRRS